MYIKIDPALRPPLPNGLNLPGSNTNAGGSTTTTPGSTTPAPAAKPLNLGGRITSKSPEFKNWLANGNQIAKSWNFPNVTNMYGEKITQDAFLKTIIYIESNGVHQKSNGKTITSSCGALGFMQLMPNTAKGLGVNPNDPKQNIAGGAKFLRGIFNKGKVAGKPALDKLIMAGCAYNCGPYSKRLDQSWSSFVKDSKAPKETRRYGLKVKMCLGIKLTTEEETVARQLLVPKSKTIDQYARDCYSYAKGIGQ
ncbi:MAG: transglycosylase SLT domain-containing protein [Candidatus Riflebacteria bacterium]|nr:transglycosylase SLT domain-containing protein [Candidatus Riflebacteria bacterium]